MKAVTFSFDDGVIDDLRVVSIFRKYGLKGTFNFNSGSLTECSHWFWAGGPKEVCHLNYLQAADSFLGQEIAVHTLTHPDLTELDLAAQKNQIGLDRRFLSSIAGYEVVGMATPYGKWNQDTLTAMKEEGIKYCRCDVSQTLSFDYPKDPLLLQSTCHFLNPKRMELAEEFIHAPASKDLLFYIWGHTYELVTDQQWKEFEDFCRYISGRPGISYLTNREALGF